MLRISMYWSIITVIFLIGLSRCKSIDTSIDAKMKVDLTASANKLMDDWHHAAATADEDVFFGSMTSDAIYIGTDASEYWLRDELKNWSAKYFEKDSAWVFHPHDRHVYIDPTGQIAWFDELLDTWMKDCRGSGVLQRQHDGSWLIKHYHLAIAVPNDAVQDYLNIIAK